MDSPGSPLSELESDDFPEDIKTEEHRSLSHDTFQDHDQDLDHTRPSKRLKMSARQARAPSAERAPPLLYDDTDISSDTEGSVPASPHHAIGGYREQDEEALGQEQVTACKWDGCSAGDLGNMDRLVDHLHDEHIQARQKKYSCEWVDCARKGTPHASGYALRAHMRSHTREKPFYCTLPECDRSFTRSDALAKHMRTVHETEALRPSDPVPKHHSSNPSNRFQRLRLTINKSSNGDPKSEMSTPISPSIPPTVPEQSPAEVVYENNNVVYTPNPEFRDSNGHVRDGEEPWIKKFPSDIDFTAEEKALPADELYKRLLGQESWSNAVTAELREESSVLESDRRDEWVAKELALDNLMEATLAAEERIWERKKANQSASRPDVANKIDQIMEKLRADAKNAKKLPLDRGPAPWYRPGEGSNNEEWVTLIRPEKNAKDIREQEYDVAASLQLMASGGYGFRSAAGESTAAAAAESTPASETTGDYAY